MSIKHDETSKLIEAWVKTMNNKLPINLSFVSDPIAQAITERIRTLERIYSKSKVYRYLSKKGVYPILLFSTMSGMVGYSAHRAYTRSTQFVIHLVGVLYPTYCCWQLVKHRAVEDDDQLKSWLTYWMIFGSFQVLDHWMKSDLFTFSKDKYNLYKLIILYWAQNPHSRGAYLLYKHVIQKPIMHQEEEHDEKQESVVIEQETMQNNYRYMDGFMPPNLSITPTHHNNSSSSDEEEEVVEEEEEALHITLSSQKETFPLLMNAAESAW